MEAGEILKMVEYALCHICFIIYVIVRNYDIKILDFPNHPSIGSQGQVMKTSKGNLDNGKICSVLPCGSLPYCEGFS